MPFPKKQKPTPSTAPNYKVVLLTILIGSAVYCGARQFVHHPDLRPRDEGRVAGIIGILAGYAAFKYFSVRIRK